MNNIVLQIAYDGTDFLGWQKAEGPSIEGALEEALYSVLQERPKLQAASRTDKGVHAEEQYVNFHLERLLIPIEKLPQALNAKLPHSIRVFHAFIAPPSFHPTLDNNGKTYRYQIVNSPIAPPRQIRTHWHVYAPLNIDRMRMAIPYFLGPRDFAAFTNQSASPRENTVRELDSIHISDDFVITITGKSFLYKMVRNIVGTLVHIGEGKIALEDLPNIFAKSDRKQAGITAPAHGLTLAKVDVVNSGLFG